MILTHPKTFLQRVSSCSLVAKNAPWKFGLQARKLPVIYDLLSLAKTRGWNYCPIFPATSVIRQPSRTIPEEIRALLEHPNLFLVRQRRDWELLKYSRLIAGECYSCVESFWVDVPDCWIHIPSGTVISHEREILGDSTISLDSFYQGYSEQSFDAAQDFDENFLLLATAHGHNYAHWLFDALHKLAADPSGERRVLLGQPVSHFQRESLQLLGIGEEKIVVAGSQLIRCRNLRISVTARTSGLPHPQAIHWIRNRLLQTRIPAVYVPQRIYLSRQKSSRKIVNQSDLDPILANYGFEQVLAEELDMLQQIQMFSQAEMVLAPHGAGTANVIFMPAGSSLIEIYNPQCWDHTASRLASICGVNHWHFFAQDCGDAFDLQVDPLLVHKLLAAVFAQKEGISPVMIKQVF